MNKLALTGALAAMVVASAAVAQTSNPSPGSGMPGSGSTGRSDSGTTGTTGSSTSTSSPSAMKASSLIGTDIRNNQNQKIGEIEDVIVGEDGRVQRVVVSVGGFLGVGDKHVAIGWNDLRMNPNRDEASVNMTEEQLKAAPAYQEPRRTLGPGTGSPTNGTAPGGTRSRTTQ